MQRKNKLAAMCAAAMTMAAAMTATGQVVISQVYGGGGNAGAPWNFDYVELHNKGGSAVLIENWSLQYAPTASAPASAPTGRVVLPLGATIAANGYYLVQLQSGGVNGVALSPAADFVAGGFNMSATNGKIMLANVSTALATTCPNGTTIVDHVGFGTANCAEGAAAPAGSNTLAIYRAVNGCTDSDNNASDFSTAAPVPRSSASAPFACPNSIPPSGAGNSVTICPGDTTTLTVTVTPGSNPTSTGISVEGNLSSIGGGSNVAFLNDGVFPDVSALDNIYTTSVTEAIGNTGNGTIIQSIPVVIRETNVENRTGNASCTVSVRSPKIFANYNGPGAVCASLPQVLTVQFTPSLCAPSTGVSVRIDLSSVGGNAGTAMHDDGLNGDATAADGIYSYLLSVTGTPSSPATLPIDADDAQGHTTASVATLNILSSCPNSASTVVISQLYGGGGNAGGLYKNDFVELFNRGSVDVDISGWSLQRAGETSLVTTMSTGPSDFFVLPANSIIGAKKYFLVQMSQGNDGSQPALPTPDAIGAETVGSTGGKMYLVNDGNLITSFTQASIVDKLGYGSAASDFEGDGSARVLTNLLAAYRAVGGCQDTDNNNIDFFRFPPSPRNSSTPIHNCGCHGSCVADFDDGNGGGVPDGGVGIEDLLYYLVLYDGGVTCADVDDGNGNGVTDGGVGIEDLLYYLQRYDNGC